MNSRKNEGNVKKIINDQLYNKIKNIDNDINVQDEQNQGLNE